MEKNKILDIINGNVCTLAKAWKNLYHHKDNFYKTKRGAEGYIKRESGFSYYDDYTQDLVSPNANLEITEILETELKDIKTDKELWQNYIFENMGRIQAYNMYNNIICTAKNAEVSEEVLNYIQSKINEIKNTGSMKIDKFETKETEIHKEEDSKEQVQDDSNEDDNIIDVTITEPIEQIQETKQTTKDSTISTINVEVNYNQDKNGIELKFSDKPSTEIREQLKINGFRWSKFQKIWYAKDTQDRRDFIKDTLQIENIDNTQTSNSTITESSVQPVEYPEIDINDINSYTVDEELSRQENNNSMFRSHDINHTKELQKTLQSANDDVIELCSMPECTPYIEYKAKTYLQSFKRKYTDAYIAVLQHKVDNPSWMITGRSGLNVSKYNKKQDQLTNKMQYECELIDSFNEKIQQYKNKIESLQDKKELDEYLQAIKDIDISKETFTHTKVKIHRSAITDIFNNASYEVNAYKYKNYYILKNYGSFRIYNNQGQEVEQKYRDGTLKSAKTYLLYYLSNSTITDNTKQAM